MKEFNDLTKAANELNEKFNLKVKVTLHKAMFKLENIPGVRTMYGNYKQIFDMMHRTYRKYDVVEEVSSATTTEIEEAMQNEADEAQAQYEEEQANIEYGGPHE